MSNQTITSKVLSERAILLHLSIGGWAAKVADEDAKNVIINSFGSAADRIDAKKCLIDPEVLKDIRNAGAAARVWHYKYSVPWMDGGLRLIPSIKLDEHAAKLRDFKSAWEGEKAKLAGIIEQKLTEGRAALGGLGKDEDYPTVDEVMAKFKFSFGLVPVPDERDIRVELSAEGMAEAQASVNRLVDESSKGIVIEIQSRVAGVVQKIIEKLNEKGQRKNKKTGALEEGYVIFRDSLVQNALDLIPLIRDLNILEDPAVEKLAQDLETALGKVDVDKIREDENYRAEIATNAKSILDSMALGGFGSGGEDVAAAA